MGTSLNPEFEAATVPGRDETPVKVERRVLETEEIGKAYGGRQVVRGVSIQIAQGEVVGLLGPNGAG